MTPARSAAFRILLAVERGGYASDLLDAAGLEPRDAGLASEIVFGVLRRRAQLDFLIEHYSGRKAKLDPPVRAALRMGVYQMRYLDRVPSHAAVSQSVELVKRAKKTSAAGFVNAVLRKVDREPVRWPDRATELSHPAWLLERWDAQYGRETADAIARANLRQPETYIRVPRGSPPPRGAKQEGPPGCYRVPAGETGGFRIQDIGSQSIPPLLKLKHGQTLLDLCAAPGGKTKQALESGVRAIACDVHPRRIAMLRGAGADLVVLDGTRPLPFGRRFERILLDAPCSGTGTLARNPEIKWKLKPEDLPKLQKVQRSLLTQARAALAPGGLMVYSTCSLEHEENEDVIASLDPAEVRRILRRIPGRDAGDGFFAAVIESGIARK
ncbi:MAG: transcription antitermination factor NusB [Bryobacteraceae bacterium]